MIALDAMGGDNAPEVTVHGAIDAARERSIPITLFGNKGLIEDIACSYDAWWGKLPITIVHCAESISMVDEPTRSLIQKEDSSLVQAIQSVKHGVSQAIISAGNSGACLAGAVLLLGRIPGVVRPAFASFIPTLHKRVFCLDLGANVDCKPNLLVQFAYMGVSYVSALHHIAEPRVALLSNGSEPYKGNDAVKRAYNLLQNSSLHFVGNVEPSDIFNADIDVLVCDGFAGNIMLKTMQGTAQAIKSELKRISSMSLWYRLSALCSRPLLQQMHSFCDYSKRGGALLLGVRYPFIVTHGSCNAQAIQHAIYYAYEVVNRNIVTQFSESFCQFNNVCNTSAEYQSDVT